MYNVTLLVLNLSNVLIH